jgi:tight adherence protein B
MEWAILIIAGFVTTLALARVGWSLLRPEQQQSVSMFEQETGLFVAPEDTGLEARLARFFSEAELDWTPSGVLGWTGAILSAVYLAGASFDLHLGWLLFAVVILMIIAVAALVVRRNRRLNGLRNQLPDVVSLIARSSRAGLAIEEAFVLCEKMARGRLQSELQHCRNQLSLGRSLPGTMESLASRVQLPELGLLSTLLSVHRQTGGGLADSLDRLSVLLRDRIQFRNQMSAASSGGRLSATLIAPAAPLLFATLLVLSPEHVEVFFTTGLGRIFFVLGILLNLIGIAWIVTLIRMPR